jgi:hypothetical protein
MAADSFVDHPGHAAAVAAAAIVLALLLHPLQFSMIQVMEGYWTGTRLGRALAARKISGELARYGKAVDAATVILRKTSAEPVVRNNTLLYGPQRERAVLVRSALELAGHQRVRNQYPSEPAAVMPTRLGNILRRHELAAGAAYGLSGLELATHIGLVADPAHVVYLRDQRQGMELAARVSVSSVIATLVSAVLLWPYGLWLLVALVPYSAAYLAYRGAVTSAASLGAAVMAVTDLNRFTLYTALHLPLPPTSQAERKQNEQFARLLYGSNAYAADYAHPDASGPSDQTLDESSIRPQPQPATRATARRRWWPLRRRRHQPLTQTR